MVDAVAFALAACIVCARLIWRKQQHLTPVLDLRETLTDFLAAAALVPFMLMMGTAFSDVFVRDLLVTSKGAIWMAGGVGFIYLTKELLTKPKGDRATSLEASIPKQ